MSESREVPCDSRPELPHKATLGCFCGCGLAEGGCRSRPACNSSLGLDPASNKELFLTLCKPSAAIHRHNSLAKERWQTKYDSAEKH